MKAFLTPLSPEEEVFCVNRIAEGDLAAREQLILHNLRLVAHVVKRYQGSGDEVDDLISIGTIGLMKAVDSFRPDYGSRFATYAIRCVDNELLMYMRSKRKRRGEVSLFEPIGTDKEGNQIHLVDILEHEEEDVTERMDRCRQLSVIQEQIKRVLTEREYMIITKRYGLGGEKEYTQRELARELGISRSYVSRIEKKALLKLRKILTFTGGKMHRV